MKILFIVLQLLFVMYFVNSQSQYIYTFTNDNTFMIIDINTGELVLNNTLPLIQSGKKNFPLNVNYITSLIDQTFTTFSSYQPMIGGATFFITINYEFQTNQFSTISKPVLDVDLTNSDPDQKYIQIGNNFYIPTVDYASGLPDLTISNWDFDTRTLNLIQIELADYNSSIAVFSSLDSINNKMYLFYYGNDENPMPYLTSIKTPIVNGVATDVETYKIPKSNLPYSKYGGELFVVSGIVYYISNGESGVYSIHQFNLETSDVTTLISFNTTGISLEFTPYFFSSDYNYLIIMDGGNDYNNSQVIYKFIDLQNDFNIVYTFQSPNFFNYLSFYSDSLFYFNGSFSKRI
ncbi:hypothetical protein RB653_005462 [Dictyostelium firmibasis]|uniref:Uncharacterized protein n=1 Tax=Dictyostelium firmibasis TaxID=79012 RepID=A0AAN7U1A3_9MYCE